MSSAVLYKAALFLPNAIREMASICREFLLSHSARIMPPCSALSTWMERPFRFAGPAGRRES